MVHQRRLAHATAVRAEAHGVLAEIRTLIASRLAFANEQLEALEALQGENQKLIELLAKKAGIERGRLEQARAMMGGLRSKHNMQSDELERLLDPEAARAAALRARAAGGGRPVSQGSGV